MGKFSAGFAGSVALITGAASGIGLATARRLAAEGATVVIADLDEVAAKTAAQELRADSVAFDVADPEAIVAAELHDGVLSRGARIALSG